MNPVQTALRSVGTKASYCAEKPWSTWDESDRNLTVITLLRLVTTVLSGFLPQSLQHKAGGAGRDPGLSTRSDSLNSTGVDRRMWKLREKNR